MSTGPNWSNEHANQVTRTGKTVEDNYFVSHPIHEFIQASNQSEDALEAMLRKTFTHAFHAGAGCSHKLTETGI